MTKKKELIDRLYSKPFPKNFTVHDLDLLMKKCNCIKFNGGRGSSIGYMHISSKRILQFDGPHPQKELYRYQAEKTRKFIEEINEREG